MVIYHLHKNVLYHHLDISLSIYGSPCVYIFVSVSLSLWLSMFCLSGSLSLYLSLSLYVLASLCHCVCLCLSVCLILYLHLSHSLYIFLSRSLSSSSFLSSLGLNTYIIPKRKLDQVGQNCDFNPFCIFPLLKSHPFCSLLGAGISPVYRLL